MFFYHLIMQMIPGTYPGASHEPDHLPLFHLRTFPGVNECQVCVSGLKSETVRNDYRFPISGRFTCERHRPTGCGVYGSRIHRRHIQACVNAFHRLSDASGSRNGRISGISLSGVRQRGRNGKYPRPFGRSPTPGRCPRNPLRSATPPRSANVCPAPPPGRQGSAQGSQG